MIPTFTARLAIALPLALALASCGDEAGTEASLAGEPVAEVAAPEGQAWSEIAVKTDRGGYLVGNPDAPIKLVEYGSLTCPACAAFSAEASEPLMREYVDSGRVSFEFRSFLIHGPMDLALTRLVDCGSPMQAVPLSDQVWANLEQILGPAQQRQQQLDAALSLPENERFPAFAEAAGLLDFFASRGLSRDQARTCLADVDALQSTAEVSQTYSTQDNVQKTPTFYLNGVELPDSQWAGVESALQRAGAR